MCLSLSDRLCFKSKSTSAAAVVTLMLSLQSYAQIVVPKEKVHDHLFAVEEKFQAIRSSCCAVLIEERTIDDAERPAPATIRLEHLFANDAKAKLRRHDVGLCGDVFAPRTERDWYWNRTLKRNGAKVATLQGNANGGTDSPDEPLFLKLLDPLALTTTATSGVLAGRADEGWFPQIFLSKELVKGEETTRGDIVATIVTSTDRARGVLVRLSNEHDFLPVECVFVRNAAEDFSKEFKPGFVYSKVVTKWQFDKQRECFLPREIRVDGSKSGPDGFAHHSEFAIRWLDLDPLRDYLFDEAEMRSRWDTVESVLSLARSRDKR